MVYTSCTLSHSDSNKEKKNGFRENKSAASKNDTPPRKISTIESLIDIHKLICRNKILK